MKSRGMRFIKQNDRLRFSNCNAATLNVEDFFDKYLADMKKVRIIAA